MRSSNFEGTRQGIRAAGQFQRKISQLIWRHFQAVVDMGNGRQPYVQPGFDGRGGHGTSKSVALKRGATESLQGLKLSRVLHSLGDGLEPEAGSQRKNRLDGVNTGTIQTQILDKRAINLDHIDRKTMDAAESRVARSKVVDGNPDAPAAQLFDLFDCPVQVPQHSCFRDFQFKQAFPEVDLRKNGQNLFEKARICELPGGDIHRHPETGASFPLPNRSLPASLPEDGPPQWDD